MQLNQYENLLIKCDYLLAVCESLQKNIQEQEIKVRISNKNKKQNAQTSIKEQQREEHYQSRLNSENNNFNDDNGFSFTHRKVANQELELERDMEGSSIKQYLGNYQFSEQNQLKKKVKQLLMQIDELQREGRQVLKKDHLKTKAYRQVERTEQQVSKLSKLLNTELKNLNSINEAKLEMESLLERQAQKQRQFNAQIQGILLAEKEHFRFRNVQQQYEKLVSKRKQIFAKGDHQIQLYENHIDQRVKHITTSLQNQHQIQTYTEKLQQQVSEQEFIIKEIIEREQQKAKESHSQTLECSNQFDEEIANLKKTIDKRKWKQQRVIPAKGNNDDNQNESKRKVQSSEKPLFKIQIEPICHDKKSPIKVISPGQQEQPPQFLNKKLNNRIVTEPATRNQHDLDTLEVQMLKRIIQKKENEYKMVMSRVFKPQSQEKLMKHFKHNNNNLKQINDSSSPKMKLGRKHYSMESYKKQPISKYMSQIIGTDQSGIMDHLKDNVRYRTKKTEQEKINQMELIKSRQKIRQRKASRSLANSAKKRVSHQNHIGLEDENQFMSQHKERLNRQDKVNSCTGKDSQESESSLSHINMGGISAGLKRRNLKYHSRVNSNSSSIANSSELSNKLPMLNKRINQLKDHNSSISWSERKNKPKQQSPLNSSSKQDIQVIKLPGNSRKNRIKTDFVIRKGADKSVQEENSSSDLEMDLSQIDEEDEFLKVTNQTISHR